MKQTGLKVDVGKVQLWDCFVRNRTKVRHYLESMVSNRDDAADLLQEVSMIILSHDDPPLEQTRFVSWCMGIARNTVLHYWRSTRRHDELFAGSDMTGYEWCLALSFERAMLDRQRIAVCLQVLDEPSRSLLFLRYVVGKTSREIARELGQSPAAVRMRIMRMRETLRGQVGR